MKFTTFDQLQAHLAERFQQGEYAEALDTANQHAAEFPEFQHMVNYWRSVLAARLENAAEAVTRLREVIETGFWYGDAIFRESPSFRDLQGQPDFEALFEINQKLRAADPEQHYPLVILRAEGRCQSSADRCPLLLGLHSNAGTAQTSLGFWQPVARAGWLVAAPQSSQSIWKSAYVWNNREQAEADVVKSYQSLVKQYSVDNNRIVAAGHSLGGDTAIWLTLNGAIPAMGFIAMTPGGPLFDNPDAQAELILSAQGRGLRGYIITGAEDEVVPNQGIEIFVDMLNEAGIPCELESVPHAGHDYIPEYDDAVLRALSFVSQEL